MTSGQQRRRVRLRDVAERAGVSATTASFVLSGRDMRISEPTRHRVERAARELDYRPNLTARSLRTQRTRTIGLVADTIATGQFGGGMIRGSLTAALRHHHRLLVAETEGVRAVEVTLIEDLIDRQVDGYLYATTSHDDVVVPRPLRGRPVVLLNCRTSDDTPAIVPDEAAGGRAAAGALLRAGHRDGIFLVGEAPAHVVPAQERISGVDATLREAGSGIAGLVECSWWPESAYDAMSAFLARGGRPAALICLNDRIAFGAYQAIAEAGLEIPKDISVVSFDDTDLATWVRPALTSVALPLFEMGALAVETLLSEKPQPGIQLVPMPLRERASVAKPALSQ
jgi:LacI family transcriptional regulator